MKTHFLSLFFSQIQRVCSAISFIFEENNDREISDINELKNSRRRKKNLPPCNVETTKQKRKREESKDNIVGAFFPLLCVCVLFSSLSQLLDTIITYHTGFVGFFIIIIIDLLQMCKC